jgi:hypothetical protein
MLMRRAVRNRGLFAEKCFELAAGIGEVSPARLRLSRRKTHSRHDTRTSLAEFKNASVDQTNPERYRARRRGVKDCDAALIFGEITSPGSRGLIRDCQALGKPWVGIRAGLTTPRMIFAIPGRITR